MKYQYQAGSIENRLAKKIFVGAIAAFMAVTAITAFTFADRARDIYSSGEPNCVGEFASDHAKRSESRGLRGILDAQRHIALEQDGYYDGEGAVPTNEEMRTMAEACRDNRVTGPVEE